MQFPAQGIITLRTNLSDSDVSRALKAGDLPSDIVAFDFCGPKVAHNGFKAMVRQNAFEAGELAIATFLQAKAYGKPYILLPLPISGRLQHHCIGYNSMAGVLGPKDMEGRTVGVRTYSQTTALWVRGILQHDFGVDPAKVNWVVQDDAHLAEHRDPPNVSKLSETANLAQMLVDGELSIALLGNDMPKEEHVRPLIPDPQAAGKDWYRREGVIPVNHMFVVREELSRQRPDVVREIYRLLVASRNAADPAKTRSMPPYGYEALKKTIQFAADWSYEQGLVHRRLSLDELFDETTASLND